jgi:hypothetical protein
MSKQQSWKQLAQEILRASEERIAPKSVEAMETPQEATETTKIPQVTLVQDRNFSEVQVVQGMGGLMYQQAQMIMKQMQDNQTLLDGQGLPTDNLEESPAGPSDPDFMNLDNINGSDNPESTMPPTGSPVGVMTQPETGGYQ